MSQADIKPSKIGDAASFKSILQYAVIGVMGFATYAQKQATTASAWAYTELQATRVERQEHDERERAERQKLVEMVAQALLESRGARQVAEKTQRTTEQVKKAVEAIE